MKGNPNGPILAHEEVEVTLGRWKGGQASIPNRAARPRPASGKWSPRTRPPPCMDVLQSRAKDGALPKASANPKWKNQKEIGASSAFMDADAKPPAKTRVFVVLCFLF